MQIGNFKKVQQYGFTFYELMVVSAVVIILLGVAVPSYLKYRREARLYEAKGVLLKNVLGLERHYALKYKFKKNSTTWADLEIKQNAHFCFKLQGQAKGVKGDRFTMKAVALDKKAEPRVVIIDDDHQMRVCESTVSVCDNQPIFAGSSSRTDKNCKAV